MLQPDPKTTLQYAANQHIKLTIDESLDIVRVLYQSQQWTTAEVLLNRILRVVPDAAELWNVLGNTLKKQSRMSAAVNAYRRSVQLQPEGVQTLNNLGHALTHMGQFDEAEQHLRTCLRLQPDFAFAHNNLGVNLFKRNHLQAATSHFKAALANQPDYHKALYNLLKTLLRSGHYQEARDLVDNHISEFPNDLEALNIKGLVLTQLHDFEQAITTLTRLIAIDPNNSDAMIDLGLACQRSGQLANACHHYQRSIELNADQAAAYSNLGLTLTMLGQHSEAVAAAATALQLHPDQYTYHKNLLVSLIYAPDIPMQQIFTAACRFDKEKPLLKPASTAAQLAAISGGQNHQRLRIGYLSSDFRDHPVGRNIWALFAFHDRERYELYCYADVGKPDSGTTFFRQHSHHWRELLGCDDAQAAATIRRDRLHILVVLAGCFDQNRIHLCRDRLAPVQVNFHNAMSSGFTAMDFWLTDRVLHPDDSQEPATEAFYRLPCFYQFVPPAPLQPPTALPADHNGWITFGSFNNPAKLTKSLLGLWAKVLQAVPNSRLLLKYHNYFADRLLQHNILDTMQHYGITSERIVFLEKRSSYEEFMQQYEQLDIALDTFPFNGASTTFSALHAGIPVVTLAGESFIQRAAAGIVIPAGLPELVAQTETQYVQICQTLAMDLPRLRSYRERIPQQLLSSLLCDGKRYTQTVECAYQDMWQATNK